jgi:spore maturation protein CgeB
MSQIETGPSHCRRAVIESRNFHQHPLVETLGNQGWEIYPAYQRGKTPEVDFWLANMYSDIKQPLEFRLNVADARRRGIPVLTWNRDAPWNLGAKSWRLWLIRNLRYLDMYLSHSMQGAERFAPELHYFPNAADTSRYNLSGNALDAMRDPDWYQHDVSFVGNIDARAHPEMRQRVALLNEIEVGLKPLGIRCHFVHSAKLTSAEQIEIIQRSRINLNVGAACDDGPEPSWGLPERCYGIQACGGLLLSDFRAHARDDFEPEREWLDFQSVPQCVERIQHLLSDLQHARDIAEAAYSRVMAQHTYRHRASQLLALVADWRKRNNHAHS